MVLNNENILSELTVHLEFLLLCFPHFPCRWKLFWLLCNPFKSILTILTHGLRFMGKGGGGCVFIHANVKAGTSKNVLVLWRLDKYSSTFWTSYPCWRPGNLHYICLLIFLFYPFTQNEIRINRHSYTLGGPVFIKMGALERSKHTDWLLSLLTGFA